jgi:hypothetical protein
MPRHLRSGIALGLLLVLCGCSQNKRLEADVSSFKAEIDPDMQLMLRYSKFLKKKVGTVTAKIDKLESESGASGQELGRLTAEPAAAKRDILAAVDVRADSLAMFQKTSLEEFGRFLEGRDAAVRATLQAEQDTLKSTLGSADVFVRFVFTYQDSVNREFAQRFDQKPWYTSILGRWGEHNKSPQ